MKHSLLILIAASACFFACNSSSSDSPPLVDLSSTDTALPQSPALREMILALEAAPVKEIDSANHIPEFILSYLDSITEGFSIAEKDEDWQSTCVWGKTTMITKTLDPQSGDTITITTYDTIPPPTRQFVCFAMGEHVAMLSYKTGGFGVMQHVILFMFEDLRIISVWHQGVETDLTTNKEILYFLKHNEERIWSMSAGSSIL